MNYHLKEKVIIVTGGASGIGRAISIAIAEEGGIPIIVGRDADLGQSLVEDLASRGSVAHSVEAELGNSDSCYQVLKESVRLERNIYGLVNNAGQNDSVGLEDGSEDAWMRSLEKNLHHYYHMTRFCLPELKKTKGVIVNVSSKTAVTGQGGTSAYAAAKGAQLALTREWAVELLPFEIRVNAVIPSEVYTPLYKRWLNQLPNPSKKKQEIESRIPLGNRMTRPKEIADMVLFLISDRSSHITGQHMYVDGGYVHLDRSSGVLSQ